MAHQRAEQTSKGHIDVNNGNKSIFKDFLQYFIYIKILKNEVASLLKF
jgi:hypothetical protein